MDNLYYRKLWDAVVDKNPILSSIGQYYVHGCMLHAGVMHMVSILTLTVNSPTLCPTFTSAFDGPTLCLQLFITLISLQFSLQLSMVKVFI